MAELNIYQKLNNFSIKVGTIHKDKTNPFHKSKYADINDVLEAIRGPLSENGLVIVQTIKKNETESFLNTKVVNIDNPDEFIEIDVPLIFNGDMQKLGSAMTYARRYGIVTLLGLQQEDDDGNLASQNQEQNNNNTNAKKQMSNFLLQKGIPKEKQKVFANYAKNYNLSDLNLMNNQNFLNLIEQFKNENKS